MRITPFLEFDDINPGNPSANDTIILKVSLSLSDKSIEVLEKHARY